MIAAVGTVDLPRLNEHPRDLSETDKVLCSSADGEVEFSILLNSNDIVVAVQQNCSGERRADRYRTFAEYLFGAPGVGTLSVICVLRA